MAELAFVKQPQQCLWCRKADDVDVYGPGMLLTCDVCFNAHCHVACDAVRRAGPPLSKEHVLSGKPWFCSADCRRVHSSLHDATNAAREPLLESSEQLTFELVKHSSHGLGGLKTEGSARYTHTCCAAVVKLMHDAFAPLIMEDGSDMVHLVCHSASSSDAADTDGGGGSQAYDFSGFRVAVVRHRGTVVCAAALRCFGTSFAEMPFVATRDGHRKSGHCRRLMAAVTAKLAAWGVHWLLLPSVPETQRLWMRHFGFVAMSAAEVAAVEGRVVCPAGDDVRMLKLRIVAPPPTTNTAPPPPASVPTPPASAKGKQASRLASAAVATTTSSCIDAAAAAKTVSRGTGSFTSLAATLPPPPGGPAAAVRATSRTPAQAVAAAQAALQRLSREEALGHTLADVLLSTLYDVDDERRSAQAEMHALRMQLAQQETTIAGLRAQLQLAAPQCPADDSANDATSRAAPSEPGPEQSEPHSDDAPAPSQPIAGEAPPPVPAAPADSLAGMRCDDDDGDDPALAVLRAIADSPDRVLPLAPVTTTSQTQKLPAATPAATPAQSPTAMPTPPPACLVDEAARREAIMCASAVLRRMPPGATTWLADGTGTPLLPGEPLPFQVDDDGGPAYELVAAAEEIQMEYM